MAISTLQRALTPANPHASSPLPASAIARLLVQIEGRNGGASILMDAPITPLDRAALEREIDGLITLLDVIDGDPEDQQADGDELDTNGDEDAAMLGLIGHPGIVGNDDDEDDDPVEENGDEGDYSDGGGGLTPIYGLDQTQCPMSEARAAETFTTVPIPLSLIQRPALGIR